MTTITNIKSKPANKIKPANKAALAKQTKQSESERYAKISLTAHHMSAILSDSFTNPLLPQAELADVAIALKDKIATINNGDMQPIEAMLIGQAQALQTMFVTLGRMATTKTQLAQYTAFMNLALKAQSQSRATIQALVELKYPKQTNFVKQANIASGHQQINNNPSITDNNATSTRAPVCAKENQTQHNELLEVNNGSKTLDTRAAQTTIPKDKAVATVAT